MTALLGLPMATAATDLNSGVRSELLWTDNVYSSSVDEVDDFSGRVTPWAEVSDAEGDLNFGLRYAPAYEYYLDESGLRGFDHDVDGRVAWRVGPRTTLRLFDHFQRFHSVSRFNEQADPGQDVIVAGRRERYKTNLVGASIEHRLTPRDLLALNVSYSLQNFSDESQLDRNFLGTSAVYRHSLSERAILGVRGSWSRQTVERIEVSDTDTDYVNLSGLFEYAIDPTLHFELTAGPAWVLSNPDELDPPPDVEVARFPLQEQSDGFHFLDADSCPQNANGDRLVSPKCNAISPALTPAQLFTLNFVTGGNRDTVPFVGTVPGVDDSTTTYFADVALVKDWERVTGELSYQRREDQTSGFGAVSDFFYGSLRWQVTRRITAKLTTYYEMREQATDSIVLVPQVTNQATPVAAFPLGARSVGVGAEVLGSDVGVDVLYSNLRIGYQLTPRSELYSTLSWRDETSSGDVVFERDMQRFGIIFGINVVFDPIDL